MSSVGGVLAFELVARCLQSRRVAALDAGDKSRRIVVGDGVVGDVAACVDTSNTRGVTRTRRDEDGA